MRLYREVTADAPDELTCLLILRKAPPAPFIPPEFHGKPIAAIAGALDRRSGRRRRGDASRSRAFGPPVADTIAPKDFIAFQTFLDGGQPFGRRYYWKSHEAGEVSDGLIGDARRLREPDRLALLRHPDDAHGRRAGARSAPRQMPSAFAAPATASSSRARGKIRTKTQLHIGWARDSLEALKPFSSGGSLLNFLTEEEGEGRIRAAYDPATYDRLRRIKTVYDPDNLFRGNLNIPPF